MFCNIIHVCYDSLLIFLTHHLSNVWNSFSCRSSFIKITISKICWTEVFSKGFFINLNEGHKWHAVVSVGFFSSVAQLRGITKYFVTFFGVKTSHFDRSLHERRGCTAEWISEFLFPLTRSRGLLIIGKTIVEENSIFDTKQLVSFVNRECTKNKIAVRISVLSSLHLFLRWIFDTFNLCQHLHVNIVQNIFINVFRVCLQLITQKTVRVGMFAFIQLFLVPMSMDISSKYPFFLTKQSHVIFLAEQAKKVCYIS